MGSAALVVNADRGSPETDLIAPHNGIDRDREGSPGGTGGQSDHA